MDREAQIKAYRRQMAGGAFDGSRAAKHVIATLLEFVGDPAQAPASDPSAPEDVAELQSELERLRALVAASEPITALATHLETALAVILPTIPAPVGPKATEGVREVFELARAAGFEADGEPLTFAELAQAVADNVSIAVEHARAAADQANAAAGAVAGAGDSAAAAADQPAGDGGEAVENSGGDQAENPDLPG